MVQGGCVVDLIYSFEIVMVSFHYSSASHGSGFLSV